MQSGSSLALRKNSMDPVKALTGLLGFVLESCSQLQWIFHWKLWAGFRIKVKLLQFCHYFRDFFIFNRN